MYHINLPLILFNKISDRNTSCHEKKINERKNSGQLLSIILGFLWENDETISLSTLVILSYSLIVINRYAGKIDDSRIQASFVCRDYNDSRYKATLGRSDPLRKMMFVPVWLLVELAIYFNTALNHRHRCTLLYVLFYSRVQDLRISLYKFKTYVITHIT